MALRDLTATPGEAAAARVSSMFGFSGNARSELWSAICAEVDRAVAVERERCAQIAEAPAWSAPTANGEWALREVAKIVATQIRAGD
jgi:hypothetical protein